MGIGPKISGSIHDSNSNESVNPNPYLFEIIDYVESPLCFRNIAVKIQYTGCTNYEGVKILVFNGVSIYDLKSMNAIDPHFCEDVKVSPVARFKPDDLGWKLAIDLIYRLPVIQRNNDI